MKGGFFFGVTKDVMGLVENVGERGVAATGQAASLASGALSNVERAAAATGSKFLEAQERLGAKSLKETATAFDTSSAAAIKSGQIGTEDFRKGMGKVRRGEQSMTNLVTRSKD